MVKEKGNKAFSISLKQVKVWGIRMLTFIPIAIAVFNFTSSPSLKEPLLLSFTRIIGTCVEDAKLGICFVNHRGLQSAANITAYLHHPKKKGNRRQHKKSSLPVKLDVYKHILHQQNFQKDQINSRPRGQIKKKKVLMINAHMTKYTHCQR